MFTKNLPVRYDKIGDKKYKIKTIECWEEIAVQQVRQQIVSQAAAAQSELDKLSVELDALEALDEQ